MPSGLPDVVQRFSADSSGYDAGIARMIKGNEDLIASIAKVKREIAGLGAALGALPDKRVKVEVTGVADAIRQVGELKTALDSLGDRRISIGGDNGEMVRHLKDISTYMDMATDSMQRMEDHLVVISKNAQDSSADLMMQTQILRDNASAHTAAATAVNALSAAQRNAGGGGGGWGATAAAAGAAAAGGGGGRGRWTAAQYAGFGGGGGPDFPAGSAGAQANAIVGFVKRWWGPVHWAMMTTNELLATLGPATAAAGAATLVGWQGVEQMIPRIKAINATAESLGGAYGITSGQYLGTGNAIQRYQNLATGGVYELGGAGINLMRAGAGTFGQMGLNTIAMLDRGVAAMQIGMAQRGTMGTLAGLLGGGTDYLRTFGDIGGNIGNIFLGLAPHLPGVGGDYLSALKGITGGLAGGIGLMNRGGLGDALGLGMAGEAGLRVGTPMVGLLGKLISSGGAGLARLGLGTGLGDAGLGIAGFGDALGMLSGPQVALLAMSAFAGSKLISSMPSPAQRQMAALQAQVGQAGFSAAFHPLAHAIVTSTGLAASAPGGIAAMMGTNQSPGSYARFGQIGPTTGQVYASASGGFERQLGNLINAGPQLVDILHRAGLSSVSMAQGFQIAQNALLDLNHAFDQHGHLTRTAQQQLQNYVAAIGPMTRSGGAFNAAIGAQQIMGSPAMQNLSKVNQAMDSMIQIASGGPAGMATLFGMLGGTPTTVSHGGMKLAAGPGVQAMAKALTSFTSAGGAAAWRTFAGPQGLVAAEQQNLDQLRTYMTLGALGAGGAAGIAGFQLQQLLPMARRSPAALAMLMQQGAGIGIGGYYQGTGTAADQARNYAAFQKALGGSAFDSRHLTQAMNQAVINASNIPATAAHFMQGVNANIASQQMAQAAQDVARIRQAGGGAVPVGAARDLAGLLRAQGLHGEALTGGIDAALKQAGVSRTMRLNIEAQVNTAQVKAQLAGIKSIAPVHVQVHADGVAVASQQIQGIRGKTVPVVATATGVGAAQAAINSVHGKVVDIVINTIVTGGGVSAQAMRAAGYAPGVSAAQIAAGIRKSTFQTGGLVPGSGRGDIVPAMLEPGEVVVPRNLVSLVAPILAAHRVPGFGAPMGASTHFAAGGIVPRVLGFPDPAPIAGRIGNLAYTLIDEITKALKSAGAGKIASALVGKLTQEVQYARSVSASMRQGLNLGGMDVTPGTGQGTVAGQMTSYLGSLKSFSADLAALRKGRLNKELLGQIVAAGPVQGDALAQSILHDYGGIRSVNQLYAQIGRYSNQVGAQAAMGIYGGTVAPNLRSAGQVTNHVTINVNASGNGTLNLTPSQIKKLTEEIQAKLLQQARRNQKTGVQLPGKGA